jgi:hypothetical protein
MGYHFNEKSNKKKDKTIKRKKKMKKGIMDGIPYIVFFSFIAFYFETLFLKRKIFVFFVKHSFSKTYHKE